MEAGKVSYYVYVTTEKGVTLNVTKAVEGLGWEENAKELSTRISFKLQNATYQKQKLSSIIKIGQVVTVKANWGAGSKEIVRGFIKEAERDSTNSADLFSITAYDCLFNMQKSQDNVYYSAGKKTKFVIKDIFKKWGVSIDTYTGPDVKMAKILYKSKNLSDIILDILDEAVKKGGVRSCVRASGNKVSILRLGSNSTVYVLNSTNCIESKYKVSIVSMVTRVKILAAAKKGKDEQKVEATVDKNIKYGVLQRVQTHASSDSLADAKKAAQKILDEHGEPEYTRTVQAPDVPPIHKGDKVSISAGSLNGMYIVKSIQHNGQTGKMSMEVETEKKQTATSSGSKSSKTSGTKMAVTARHGLNLRTAPNKSIILAMPRGSTFTWDGKKSGNWYHGTYNGKTGYAYKNWLKKK